MCSRVLNNVQAAMMQFYLVYALEVVSPQKEAGSTPVALAIFPTICFATSAVVTQYALVSASKRFGRRPIFTFGILCQIVASLLIVYQTPKLVNVMYFTVVLIGISQTITLSTSNNMINEFIGLKSKKASIVFGTFSFFDKITNGLIIYFAMNSSYFRGLQAGELTDENVFFMKFVQGIIPGVAGVIAWCMHIMFVDIQGYKNEKGEENDDF